ncbi:hypothetical protein ABZ646_14515 [Streptomyces sp. NPDC007162]|uniref:hypothetical protein n=1 Tax=Streptomyces sp. NPDC007162 TaxID=3156917 RepID=UPI0034099AE8
MILMVWSAALAAVVLAVAGWSIAIECASAAGAAVCGAAARADAWSRPRQATAATPAPTPVASSTRLPTRERR